MIIPDNPFYAGLVIGLKTAEIIVAQSPNSRNGYEQKRLIELAIGAYLAETEHKLEGMFADRELTKAG